jgi:hypothetical protein
MIVKKNATLVNPNPTIANPTIANPNIVKKNTMMIHVVLDLENHAKRNAVNVVNPKNQVMVLALADHQKDLALLDPDTNLDISIMLQIINNF